MAKYCSECGTELPEGARFCPECGTVTGSAPVKDALSKSRSGRRPSRTKGRRPAESGGSGGWLGPYTRYVVAALAVTVVLLLYIGMQRSPAGGPASGLMPGSPAGETQDFTARIQQLQQALLANPNDLQLIVSLGNAYFDAGAAALGEADAAAGRQMLEQSVTYYQRALQETPESAEIRTDLGTAYNRLGREQEAIAEFRRVLEYRPDFQTALFNLGVVHQNIGDQAAAREWFQRALEAGPGTPLGQAAMEQLANLPPEALPRT